MTSTGHHLMKIFSHLRHMTHMSTSGIAGWIIYFSTLVADSLTSECACRDLRKPYLSLSAVSELKIHLRLPSVISGLLKVFLCLVLWKPPTSLWQLHIFSWRQPSEVEQSYTACPGHFSWWWRQDMGHAGMYFCHRYFPPVTILVLTCWDTWSCLVCCLYAENVVLVFISTKFSCKPIKMCVSVFRKVAVLYST